MKTLKTAIYCGRGGITEDPRLASLIAELEGVGCEVAFVGTGDGLPAGPSGGLPAGTTSGLPDGTDILLSVGGDGTFLSAASLAAEKGVPILGVNFGRLGFLSETRPEGVAQLLAEEEYSVEERIMLHAEVTGGRGILNVGRGAAASGKGAATADGKAAEIMQWPYALNEVTVHRAGAAMLGVDVTIDGMRLPTYWADGLLVATPSGSTAYSLSVGGPIVMPEADVLVVAPISPHNLNVRPLIVPKTSKIELGLRSREKAAVFTMDNRTAVIGSSAKLSVSMAQFSLKRIRPFASNFINALTGKLFWGEDIRNSTD